MSDAGNTMFFTRIAIAFAYRDLPVPDPPPNSIKDKARQILSDGQFHTGSSKSVMRRIIDWLSKQLKVPFSAASGGNTVLGFVILVVFLAALAYVVSRIRFGVPSSAKPDKVSLDIDVEEDRPADVWRSEAEQAEADGQWKLALRARYRWLLGELIERQVLVNVPGRTPGEYRIDLARMIPDQSAPFASATDLFERAWYGNEATGPQENQRFRACAEQVMAATESARV